MMKNVFFLLLLLTIGVSCKKNTPPSASFTVNPEAGNTDTEFFFDAGGSQDAETENDKLNFRWDWESDGTWDTDFSQVQTILHRFSQIGTFTITLEVMDAEGLVDSETAKLLVAKPDYDGTFELDGRNYKYKTIGNQIWMIENLAFLPTVSPPSVGSNAAPSYYVYNYEGNSISEAKTQPFYKTYGVLYNWEAAKTACPIGWHLPSDAEWTILAKFLIPSAGGKMKETGTANWISPNTGATNESFFTARPGGLRHSVGLFASLGTMGIFWSASFLPDYDPKAWQRYLINDMDSLVRGGSKLSYGLSVRCLKDQ